MMSLRSTRLGLLLAGATACAGDRGVGPSAPSACAATITPLALSVGQYRSLDPAVDSGCVALGANPSPTDSTEYLLVAQALTGQPGMTASFTLQGDVRHPAAT